jgi:hypothetical protein
VLALLNAISIHRNHGSGKPILRKTSNRKVQERESKALDMSSLRITPDSFFSFIFLYLPRHLPDQDEIVMQVPAFYECGSILHLWP